MVNSPGQAFYTKCNLAIDRCRHFFLYFSAALCDLCGEMNFPGQSSSRSRRTQKQDEPLFTTRFMCCALFSKALFRMMPG